MILPEISIIFNKLINDVIVLYLSGLTITFTVLFICVLLDLNHHNIEPNKNQYYNLLVKILFISLLYPFLIINRLHLIVVHLINSENLY